MAPRAGRASRRRMDLVARLHRRVFFNFCVRKTSRNLESTKEVTYSFLYDRKATICDGPRLVAAAGKPRSALRDARGLSAGDGNPRRNPGRQSGGAA
ncbi:hypothetical protein KL86PLE_40795 [uncultured Pleomorphomonas sp.]|uniref:Uncharacterized protein n=1 Tax=uncultured Pleomorphomonas sp. TaxID=442121 RepID=A0A212LHL4_9HYPH|nr:hypothetical protein KL86PLE_40795 [uncultured Pleomorphomonas sp.]